VAEIYKNRRRLRTSKTDKKDSKKCEGVGVMGFNQCLLELKHYEVSSLQKKLKSNFSSLQNFPSCLGRLH
jgi:hypothetical protein